MNLNLLHRVVRHYTWTILKYSCETKIMSAEYEKRISALQDVRMLPNTNENLTDLVGARETWKIKKMVSSFSVTQRKIKEKRK